MQKIKQIAEVTEAYLAYGSYDIIVKIEAESQQKIKEIVASQIRDIQEVRTRLTLVVAE